MSAITLALIAWAAMGLIMIVLFRVQQVRRDASLVDAAWAAGVASAAILYALCASGDPGRRLLLACMGGVWGMRLAAYLLFNRVIGQPEDGRYAMLREKWGARSDRNFFLFFQAQAFWTVLFSVPFLPAAFHAGPFPAWSDFAAAAVWIVAVTGEGLADRQLARFRARPENKGKTCRAGLWRYSRHPNYFFEWIHWFAYVLLAVHSPWVWVALSGPVLMLLFLYKITGIPYTEKRALLSRGEDYARYQRTTSAFFPWFPKEERS